MNNGSGLQPIPNLVHEIFFKNINASNFLYDDNVTDGFYELFVNWLESSVHNEIKGLNNFNVLKFSSGSVQIFDHFYIKHHKRRFRFFKEEFMYHKAVSKHTLDHEYMQNDSIKSNDAFLISMPFTRKGFIHPELFEVLNQCEKLNVPVLLDFCHLPVSKNVHIDLNEYDCIDTLAFSFSKMLWGAEHLRIGIRLQKIDEDDGIDVFNSVGMINRMSVGIAKEILKFFELDYNWNTYEKRYNEFCLSNNLDRTDNILYGMKNNERVIVAGSL
tara:strand:+ start:1577 stop:2392 length:816 start_codon:yes stop_codon:yes gene_type:complete